MRGTRNAVLGTLAATAVLLGCGGSTTWENTWRDPSVTSFQFKKILAVAIDKSEGTRRAFEDEMVKAINAGGRTTAVPAYSILAAEDLQDTARARAKVTAAGCDGMVTMRIVGKDKEQRLVGGTSVYGSPWGYYGYGWGMATSPTMVTDEFVQIETNIYSLTLGKLIWAGRSETTNPSSAADLVDDVAMALRDELVKDKLIPPPGK
jgi:hypothetical protein